MAGNDYLPQIQQSITPGERAEDLVAMIDILAEARTFHRRPVSPDDFQFAAAIWCFLMQPVKPPAYQSGVIEVRRSFIGIATSFQLQNRLQESFSRTLLEAPNAMVAIQQGINSLFNIAVPI